MRRFLEAVMPSLFVGLLLAGAVLCIMAPQP